MSSKSATTDPRAFSLSFALAACSRSFFCSFSSYVPGASPVGSGLGARVKVTSTCIVKRAESAACEASGFCPVSWPQWSRFCPVPHWLGAQWPGLSPWERQAGQQSRWARTEVAQRPSPALTRRRFGHEPWPQGHSGAMAPRTLRPCSTHLDGALGRERDRQRRGDSRRAIPQQGLACWREGWGSG